MKSAGNNGYVALIFLKRVIACIGIAFPMFVFDGDGAYQERLKIPVGYSSEGGERLVDYGQEYDSFEKNDFMPVLYVYDSDAEMIDALAEEEISIALLDEDEISFDNKMTDNRIILCLKIDNKYEIALCVRKHILEDHLDTAVQLARAFSDKNSGNVEVIPMSQRIDYYLSEGYSQEKIMRCAAPDFADEMLK